MYPIVTVAAHLNVKAKEFVPKEKKCIFKEKIEKILKEKLVFDNLEKEFIKNNEWLFFV